MYVDDVGVVACPLAHHGHVPRDFDPRPNFPSTATVRAAASSHMISASVSPCCRALVAIALALALNVDVKLDRKTLRGSRGCAMARTWDQRLPIPASFHQQVEAELGARNVAGQQGGDDVAALDNSSIDPEVDSSMVGWYQSRPGDFRLPPSRPVPSSALNLAFEGHPASGTSSHLRFGDHHRTVALRDDCLERNTWVCGGIPDGVFYFTVRMGNQICRRRRRQGNGDLPSHRRAAVLGWVDPQRARWHALHRATSLPRERRCRGADKHAGWARSPST